MHGLILIPPKKVILMTPVIPSFIIHFSGTTDFLQRLFRQGQAGRGILEDPAMSRESPPGDFPWGNFQRKHGEIPTKKYGNYQKKNIALLVPNLWESHKKHIYFFFHHFP